MEEKWEMTGRRILWRSPNESLLIGDYKQFNVLSMEETQDECFLKPKPNCIQVIYYVSKFISKLQHATLQSQKAGNKHTSKMMK